MIHAVFASGDDHCLVHRGPLTTSGHFKAPGYCTLVVGDLTVDGLIDLNNPEGFDEGGLFIVIGNVTCRAFSGHYANRSAAGQFPGPQLRMSICDLLRPSCNAGKVDCDPRGDSQGPVWPAMGNEMAQESIAAAGNTEVPAYLTLIELGYSVDRIDKDGEERWIAKKGTLQLMADCPLELLGLSLLRSERGPSWQASDNAIADFLTRFYPSAGRP